ncbi:RHS repeat domain-containing protein, partial [Tenacibaculum sp.]|uniref:RHS repeat domain-containing protein n=1 Tax=Tenacibaculum sp. TaxID=1906242 RepID=UPI003AA91A05
LIVCVFKTHAQFYDINTIIPNSPTTSKFEEIKSANVNEFQGSLDLTVPIFNIKIDDLEIPIYIQYDSKGIKVEEEASWIGQSWSLIAGSIITRNQIGVPDDVKKNVGFVPNSTVYINPITNQSEVVTCYTGKVFDNCGWLYSNNMVGRIVNLEKNNWNTPNHDEESKYLGSIFQGASDSAPDIFNLFLPNKKGEKFFFKDLNEIHFFDKNSIKINYSLSDSNGITEFEIKDVDGTRYKYNDTELLRYQRQNYISNSGVTNVPSGLETLAKTTPINKLSQMQRAAPYSFWDALGQAKCQTGTEPEAVSISERLWPKAWHISEITTFKGKKITYEYETDTIYNLSNTHWKRNLYLGTLAGGIYQRAYNYYNSLQKIAYPRLKKIVWNKGSIEFISSSLREDVYSNNEQKINSQSKKLDRIRVYNAKNQLVKEVELLHSYNIAEGYNNVLPEHEKSLYKRLFLEKIIIKDSKLKKVSSFNFEYDSTQLPYKFSYEQDYWGYFNNNNGATFLPNLWWYPEEERDYMDQGVFSLYPRPSYAGTESRLFNYQKSGDSEVKFADRRPNFNFSKAGILKKVIYPTGGELHLEYEQNEYLWRNINVNGPGLRIKKTTLKSSMDDVNPIITEYNYNNSAGLTNGRIQTIPMFTGLGRYFSESNPTPLYYISSAPINDFNYTFNTNFGYSSVEKRIISGGQNNGYINTEFTNYITLGTTNYVSNQGVELYKSSIFNLRGDFTYLFVPSTGNGRRENTHDYFPYPPETNFSFATGKPLVKQIFDNENNLINQKVNQYGFSDNMDVVESYFSIPGEGSSVIKYLSNKHNVLETEDKRIEDGVEIVSRTSFKYNNDFLISEEESLNSLGEKIKAEYKYPKDKSTLINVPSENLEAIDKLIENNRLSEVLQKKTYKDNALLSTEQKLFDFLEPKLSKIRVGKGTKTLDDYIVFHSYDSKGNPEEVSRKGGKHTVYIWGYYQTQPIAKIENATLAEVNLAISTLNANYNTLEEIQELSNLDDDNCTDSELCDEKNLRTALSSLRNALSPKSKVTTFTYNPLIGVTSITDLRGETTYYEYDDFNRLKLVRDADGNILKEHKYHYKN